MALSSRTRTLLAGVVGFALGGPVWGVTGYVINDLTRKLNPEKAAELQKAAATQQNLDALFDNLAKQPPAHAGSGAGSGHP